MRFLLPATLSSIGLFAVTAGAASAEHIVECQGFRGQPGPAYGLCEAAGGFPGMGGLCQVLVLLGAFLAGAILNRWAPAVGVFGVIFWGHHWAHVLEPALPVSWQPALDLPQATALFAAELLVVGLGIHARRKLWPWLQARRSPAPLAT